MYTHFFGNYLYSNKLITKEQLKQALKAKSNSRIKLGTLAINAGYMNAIEVDKITKAQLETDKRFGEIAVEMGYLTDIQVDELLRCQTANYLLLGQALIDVGAITNPQFEEALKLFKTKYSIGDTEIGYYDSSLLHDIVERYVDSSEQRKEIHIQYLMLLIKNLCRFVGDDYVLMNYDDELPEMKFSISQQLIGAPSFKVNMYATKDVITDFVSRYKNEHYTEYGEHICDGACDFLTLNNKIFSEKCFIDSNINFSFFDCSINQKDFNNDDPSMVFRVMFPFGEIIFDIEPTEEV